MASNPLEAAIQALTESIRAMAAGAGSAIGTRSAITGAPTGQTGFTALTQSMRGLFPQLRAFGQEIQRVTDTFRSAREAKAGASGINASRSSSFIIGEAMAVAQSSFLRPKEQEEVRKAAQAAQAARDNRVTAQGNLNSARSANRVAARDAVNAQAAHAAAQAQAAALGPFGAFGANVQATGQAAAQTRQAYMNSQAALIAARRQNAAAATASNTATLNARNLAGAGAAVIGGRMSMAAGGASLNAGLYAVTSIISGFGDLTLSMRQFASNINHSNIALAAYNSRIGSAFIGLGFGEIRRQVSTARETEDTTVNLVRAVDSMRDNWFAFDTSVRNIGNRLGAGAAGASGATAGAFGATANNLDAFIKGLGIGDKDSSTTAFLDKFTETLSAVITAPIDGFINAMRANINAMLAMAGMAPMAAPGAPPGIRPMAGADAFARALGGPFLGGGPVNPFRQGFGQAMPPNNWP